MKSNSWYSLSLWFSIKQPFSIKHPRYQQDLKLERSPFVGAIA